MSQKKQIKTVREVIAFLGGAQQLAATIGVDYKRVFNWKRFGEFPCNSYVVIRKLLKEEKRTAPDTLWPMLEITQAVRVTKQKPRKKKSKPKSDGAPLDR